MRVCFAMIQYGLTALLILSHVFSNKLFIGGSMFDKAEVLREFTRYVVSFHNLYTRLCPREYLFSRNLAGPVIYLG